jgi:SAM-dependent methyltransferase
VVDIATAQTGSSSPRDIHAIIAGLGYPKDWNWAWENYKSTIIAISREYGLRRHLEIGGGRDPLFLPNEIAELGFEVTLNDISAHELSLAAPSYRKVTCDIAGDNAAPTLGEGCYDLAYCRMVMEHVPDVAKMWRNIHAVLAPGGMALSFFPTLYAPPYVLNRLIPENLSRSLLEFVFPDRKPDGDNPKFPAHYDYCFSQTEKIAPMLRQAGFNDITILPFWGYSYFWKFPILKQVDAAFTRLAQSRDWRSVSSFAYVIVRK